MAKIIPLRPDMYLPLKFEIPPEDAVKARYDYILATSILEFAQRARNEVFQHGGPLAPDKREVLQDIASIIEDLKL